MAYCIFLNYTVLQKIDQEMLDYLKQLRHKIPIALVCGSPVTKIVDQMRAESLDERTLSFNKRAAT